MAEIDNLEIRIENDSTKTAAGIDALIKTLEKLKPTIQKTGLEGLSKALETLGKIGDKAMPESLTALAKSLGNIGTETQIKGISTIYRRLNRISQLNFSNLSDVPQAISNISSVAVEKISANSTPPVSVVSPDTTVSSVAPSETITDLSKVTGSVSIFSTAMEKVRSITSSVKTAFSTLSGKLKELKTHFQSTNSVLSASLGKIGQFVSSIGRIGMYRLIRTMLSSITSAFKTGISNLYSYSKSIGGAFASSMDSMAASVAFLKNSLGSLAGSIMSSLAPVLDTIISKLATVISYIAQFIAALTGKSTYTQAVKGIGGYKDAVSGAGKEAKKLKDYMLGIDELNVLKPEEDTGSGGGTGGGGAGSGLFEELEINPRIKEIAEKVKAIFGVLKDYVVAIAAGFAAWKIASRFTKNLNTIWGLALAIGGAVQFVKSIIDAWNTEIDLSNFMGILTGSAGFIGGAALLGKRLGSTVWGAAIGAVLVGIPTFITSVRDALINGINWLNATLIGVSATVAGAGIGAIIGMLGGPIGAGIGALIGLAVGALTDLGIYVAQHWEEITAWIRQKWDAFVSFMQTIPQKISIVIEAVGNWFAELPGKIGYALGYALGSVVKWCIDTYNTVKQKIPVIIENVRIWFSELPGKVYNAVVDTVNKIATWAGDIIAKAKEVLPQVVDNIVSFFKELPEKLKALGQDIWNGLINGLTAAWNTVTTAISGFCSKFVQGFKDALGIASPSTIFRMIGEFVISGLTNGFKDKASSIPAWFNTNIVQEVTNKFDSLKTGISEKLSTAKQTVINAWASVSSWFGSAVTTATSTKFENLSTNMQNSFAKAKQATQNTWIYMSTWFSSTVIVPIIGKFQTLATNMQNNFAKAKQAVQNVWASMPAWFGTSVVTPMLNKIGDYNTWYNTGRSAMSALVDGLKSVSMPTFHVKWSSDRKSYTANGKTYYVDIPVPDIRFYAMGGFPETGELFVAREAGAEMVGNIGGRTAVANNDQIVEAVALGVYEAMTAAMNSDSRDDNTKIVINLDGRKIYENQQRIIRANGYNFGMGVFAR